MSTPGNNVYYQCQRCGNCCRWPGFVKIDAPEISALAAHQSLPEHDFIQRFTRLRPQRDGLALVDKPNGECIFFLDGACSVQAMKPRQCRAFPNDWNFPGWREVCEAIPVPSVDLLACGTQSANAEPRDPAPLRSRV